MKNTLTLNGIYEEITYKRAYDEKVNVYTDMEVVELHEDYAIVASLDGNKVRSFSKDRVISFVAKSEGNPFIK